MGWRTTLPAMLVQAVWGLNRAPAVEPGGSQVARGRDGTDPRRKAEDGDIVARGTPGPATT